MTTPLDMKLISNQTKFAELLNNRPNDPVFFQVTSDGLMIFP